MSPGPRSAEVRAKIGASVRATMRRKREGLPTEEPAVEEPEEDEEDEDLPMYRCECGVLTQLTSRAQLNGQTFMCGGCGKLQEVGTAKVRR